MEITKRNEVFEVTDVNDKYSVVGTVGKDVYGHLNIDFRINRPDGTGLGNGYYNVYPESDHSDFGVNCHPNDRTEIIGYAEEIVDFIVANFKSEF